jgi:hypothetical protein
LNQITGALKEVYADQFNPTVFFSGAKTAGFVPASGVAVKGDGLNIKFKTANGFSVSMTTDVNADFPQPTAFTAANLKLRFNESNPTANDFSRLSATARTSESILQGMTNEPGAIVNFAEEIIKDLRNDSEFVLHSQMNLRRSGLAGSINGTPKNNDNDNYADATAYTAGSTSARIVLTGAVSRFQRGTRWDIYTSAGALRISNVVVTDYNPADNSVGFQRSSDSSAANFNAVVSTDQFFLVGSKDSNFYSLGEWFARPTSTDSFMFGVNRSQAANRYLLPTVFNPTGATAASPVTIDRSHFDQIALALGQISDAPGSLAYKAQLHPAVLLTLRNQIDASALININTETPNKARYGVFGSTGVVWQSPSLKDVLLQEDELAPTDSVRIINPGTWMRHTAVVAGMKFLDGTMGVFNRLPASTPGQGYGMLYQADAYMLLADVCYAPRQNGVITNIRA